MEHGKYIKFFIRLRDRGRKTPLDFQPVNDDLTEWLLSAYQFLSPLRNDKVGIGGVIKGYIPISEIVSYSEAFDLLIPLNEFTNVIRAIDRSYMEFMIIEHSSNADNTGEASD